MKLFPDYEVPSIVDSKNALAVEYKSSIYFDMSKGDIALDSAGHVKIADGRDAWIQWCAKMLVSERGTLLAYPSKIGIEMEYVAGLVDKEEKEAAIENTIRETLMNDPANRTIEVKDFEYKHTADSIFVTFCVVGADGYTGTLTMEVEGG